MSTTWNTKYGPRRVRHDPPTLEEAIFAARGLTDDVDEQIAIAAGLMEVPPEEVRRHWRKRRPRASLRRRSPSPAAAVPSVRWWSSAKRRAACCPAAR
jgi:hypothetical protein